MGKKIYKIKSSISLEDKLSFLLREQSFSLGSTFIALIFD
ncbi:hypothetical protein SLEP1_g50084 [Rubroshorea leprosula]|uniref:Uncharacterized protein n=1 Tax=Rubroshorea leprosula TaxID=152421 RepID=A0AAV5LZN8_9ROSI|nr:hypothetical protein SLEP1_g50084 [Rubroshorea leprosula]